MRQTDSRPEDNDLIVYFEWRLYNGRAADNGNIFFMYAQFDNPDDPGKMESVTCAVRYYRTEEFANVANDVSVLTYYGEKSFEDDEDGITNRTVMQLNKDELMATKVWLPDLADPAMSFASEYRPDDYTSSQSCVVGRKVNNSNNFKWKLGKKYNFRTGYKLYRDSTSTQPLNRDDSPYQ